VDLGNGVHTRERDRRGGHGGEVARAEVLCIPDNSSPENSSAATRSGRRQALCSEEKGEGKPCQGVVRDQGERSGAEGDQEGVEAHQKPAMPSGSNGGTATSGLGSLAAIYLGFWGASAERRGVYIGALHGKGGRD
jgi:hypothetical protein